MNENELPGISEKKEIKIEEIQENNLLNLLFTQSLTGIFFMVSDKPVVWNETIDKEIALDYAFENQRITRVNQGMLDQYQAQTEDLIGVTPKHLFRKDIEQGKRLWKQLLDRGYLRVDTVQLRMDATEINILGDYICLYDAERRVTGLFGVQIDVTEQKKAEKLKYLSYHDQLTGLFNRNFLDSILEKETSRAERYEEPLSMALLDLDHFKRVNDTWGHPVGDEVLKLTAQIVGRILRKSDTLFRFGGEEFLMLMPKTSIQGAQIVAEKIRQALEKTKHPVAGGVTGSLGVSQRKKSETFKSWYQRTDKALYLAKDSGRNCVVSAEDEDKLPIASVNIEWKSKWDCGDATIDHQHRELLRVANKLIYMTLSDSEFEQTRRQLELLLEHIVEHFRYEEQFLLDLGYPDQANHAQIHQKLVAKALDLKETFLKAEIKATAFFSYVVDDVVIGHMLRDDVKYFAFKKKSEKGAN